MQIYLIMKKFKFIFILLFLFNIIDGQIVNKSINRLDDNRMSSLYVPNPDTLELVNITLNVVPENNGWAIIGTSCVGCASFFYKVLRTKYQYLAEDGVYYYYFFFYFYSNSFTNYRQPTATYLNDINFYCDSKFAFNIPYLLIPLNKVTYGAWIRYINPMATVAFKVNKISVF